MSFEIIGFDDADKLLDWQSLNAAFRHGHTLPRAEIGDTFLYRGKDTLLSRAAWIDGMGALVKTAVIHPDNPKQGMPMIHGNVSLFSDAVGSLEATIDFHLVTKWKTAGDSLFAASMLARPDSRTILIVGAGTVGRSLRNAYETQFPEARFLVWNRSPEGAKTFARSFARTEPVTDLEDAVGRADIVTSATMTTTPLIKGDWLKPGQHLDLIGAYRPDMRETDDAALVKSRLFVDSRETTMDHIGELKIPLAENVIQPSDIIADFYDIASGAFARRADGDITIFKNGGGAHLDLMTSRYILDAWKRR